MLSCCNVRVPDLSVSNVFLHEPGFQFSIVECILLTQHKCKQDQQTAAKIQFHNAVFVRLPISGLLLGIWVILSVNTSNHNWDTIWKRCCHQHLHNPKSVTNRVTFSGTASPSIWPWSHTSWNSSTSQIYNSVSAFNCNKTPIKVCFDMKFKHTNK